MRRVAQARPRCTAAGASLNSFAGSTVPQLPLKSSSNHPSKDGKAALGSLASRCGLSNFPERKLSLAAWGQSLGTRPPHRVVEEWGYCSLCLQPTHPRAQGFEPAWVKTVPQVGHSVVWPHALTISCAPSSNRHQAGEACSLSHEKSLPGKKGRSPATKATTGQAELREPSQAPALLAPQGFHSCKSQF